MEQLLIDHARHFTRRGRGRTDSLEQLVDDGFQVAADPVAGAPGKSLSWENIEQAIFIKELLDRLENENVEEGKARQLRRQAEIVRLRIFVGLTEDEVAEVLGCSSETATKEFRKAKAKLASYIRRGTGTAAIETAPDRLGGSP
jgi:DNA-directed RNA polymerase specialized sigma24 family protein